MIVRELVDALLSMKPNATVEVCMRSSDGIRYSTEVTLSENDRVVIHASTAPFAIDTHVPSLPSGGLF
jgi:hypothetical protein